MQLHDALRRVTSEDSIRDAAVTIGKQINAEDGCQNGTFSFCCNNACFFDLALFSFSFFIHMTLLQR
jgi:hypothetical protein